MDVETKQIQRIESNTHVETALESFLFDRKAAGLRATTISFYSDKLATFLGFITSREIKFIEQLTANDLREFLVWLETTGHNPGGVSAHYRACKTFLNWLDFEDMPANGWKNPIVKVKAPRVDIQPLDPIDMESVEKLVNVCGRKPMDLRDKAIFLFLFDTGVRASELIELDTMDVNMVTGSVLIKRSKNRHSRTVFLAKTARKALRAYLRTRSDTNTALFVSDEHERLTYWGLRGLLTRKAAKAHLERFWSPHAFRRGSALAHLRAGIDVFSLQLLMGHSDLQVLRRYLQQSDEDLRQAHARTSPTDRL